jgi:hypothetical protein
VVSRQTGKVIGIALIADDEDSAAVALIPPEIVK